MSDKMKIIPIFVPHIGCPNDCVFCNQKKITGKSNINLNQTYVIDIIEQYKKTIDSNAFTELAFFGGSFTAIDSDLQEELLEAGKYYKNTGFIKRIRLSTRPDAISHDILMLQKKYGVDIIELGIQSLDDDVLKKSNRGHTRQDSVNASKMIKEYGFILGHQIMPGLPGSTREKDIKTCIDSIEMKPNLVRIYPTLIIKDTFLLSMYNEGLYKPLSLEEAVEISAEIYSLYKINDVNVIRIGLQNTETINDSVDVVAGPFHPAFRQLVEEKIYFEALSKILNDKELENKSISVYANKRLISLIAGQKKSNLIKIKQRYSINKISFKNIDDENLVEIYENNKKIGYFTNTEIYRYYSQLSS